MAERAHSCLLAARYCSRSGHQTFSSLCLAFHRLQKNSSVKRTSLVLLLSATILLFARGESKIIFVSQGGKGNGTSWTKATGNLHEALLMAQPDDQIWVSKGIYRTSENNDRTKSFRVPSGVKMYGGFLGFETALEYRDPKNNPTLLSGEIGTPSIADNAFTVVFTQNVSEKTVIDGFYITGGNANGKDKSRPMEYRGAAWYNLATDSKASNPVIRNCTITQNDAREGAGILNLAMNQGTCRPTISNCSFLQNRAGLNGGAIMNLSMNGDCIPVITECLFEDNFASYGAGIFNEPWGGKVEPVIKHNVFRNNKALVRNGSIHNEYSSNGSCKPEIGGNHFEGNAASVGQEKNSPSNKSAGGNKSARYK